MSTPPPPSHSSTSLPASSPPFGGICVQAVRMHRTWGEVQSAVAAALAAYDAATSGPTKWPRLTVFLQQQYGAIVAEFVQRCEAEADKQVRLPHTTNACMPCAHCLRKAARSANTTTERVESRRCCHADLRGTCSCARS